jgi:hypothetical protein
VDALREQRQKRIRFLVTLPPPLIRSHRLSSDLETFIRTLSIITVPWRHSVSCSIACIDRVRLNTTESSPLNPVSPRGSATRHSGRGTRSPPFESRQMGEGVVFQGPLLRG